MRPEAYPHEVSGIELVETHVSWVLLTGELAYKIKRPVRYGFIDLSSYERRAYFCGEELRLNRRFAPELYLAVCDIRESGGVLRIEGEGRVVERCVRMRQFPSQHQLDRLLEHDAIKPDALASFARTLADMHARLPVAGTEHRWGRPALIRSMILENVDEYLRAAAVFESGDATWTLRPALESRLDALAECLGARRRTGRVRECHGDLHTRNIVQCEGRLVAFDCMEFEPAFRWIDVAEEIALLLSDLEARGYPKHAQAFLSAYFGRSGDYAACRVLDLYKAHRALVRAKVASLECAIANDDNAVRAARKEHDLHLQAARNALASRQPRLILMSGLSGSGKTWLARQLAPEVGAIHIRSDVERKRLGGLDEQASSGSATAAGLYSEANTTALYEHLVACTRDVLEGGYTAIVDATFLKRTQRALFQELAQQADVPLQLLQCDAPIDVLRERVSTRQSAKNDASEAGLSVLDWQLKEREAIGADESLDVQRVDTSHDEPLEVALRFLTL